MGITNLSWTRQLMANAGAERLDQFVEAHCPELSRTRSGRLVKEGWVLLNGQAAKPSSTVRIGDVVQVAVPPVVPSELVPQAMPLEIVYQDAEMLVVNKPAGLIVHPAPGHPDRTLVNALLALVPDLPGIGGTQRPGIVHRLDKETSGLMMVAKTHAAHISLSAQLKERRVSKTYLALVTGVMALDEGEIDAPIARHTRYRKRMAVVPGGRDALTRYRVVARLPGYTLVEAYPVTGRTHQIRVHFAHLGHSLVGDRTYGKASAILERHFLHAARLGFELPPHEREWREFEARLPEDLQAALELLNPLSL
jgi:23S rRNA pseudouridine1911/1915/1917 synthase